MDDEKNVTLSIAAYNIDAMSQVRLCKTRVQASSDKQRTSSSLLRLLQHVASRYNAAEILEVYLWSSKIKM